MFSIVSDALPRGVGRLAPASVVLLLLLPGWSRADKAQIQQLQQKIKQLKAEEKVLVKTTQDRYSAFNKTVRLSEAERLTIRKALTAEEAQLLAITTDADAKQKIRAEYDTMRAVIRDGVRLDDAARKKIVAQGVAQVKTIRATYDGHIRALQLQIQVLKAQSPPPKKRGK